MTRGSGVHRSPKVLRSSAASITRRARAPGGQSALTRAAKSSEVAPQQRLATGGPELAKETRVKIPCAFFQEGKCSRGDKYKFSHASSSGNSAAAASSETSTTTKMRAKFSQRLWRLRFA